MMKKLNVNKIAVAAVAALAITALITLSAGTASAVKKEEDVIRGYCGKVSRGNRVIKARCTEDEKKAKARLEKRSIDPHAEAYCKRWGGEGYVELEKCVDKMEKELSKRKRRTKR